MLAAGILVYAAITDLKEFRIPNELIIVLGLLFFIHAGLARQWTFIPWNIGLALLVLALLLIFYVPGHVGGGDVKLLTVAFLWTGIDCAFAFSVLLLAFVMLHVAAAKFGLLPYEHVGGEPGKQFPLHHRLPAPSSPFSCWAASTAERYAPAEHDSPFLHAIPHPRLRLCATCPTVPALLREKQGPPIRPR